MFITTHGQNHILTRNQNDFLSELTKIVLITPEIWPPN